MGNPGPKAMSLMMRAAFNLDDPLKLGSKYVPFPAVGLIRALVQEKLPGIDEAVIRLVKDGRTRSRYIALLELLDDPKSASLVGEFLHHKERHYRSAAIRVILARHLTQYADQLFELASLTYSQGDIDRLRTDFDQGKITSQQYNQRTRPIRDWPEDQYAGTLALIDLGDPRAWQAVVTCLQGKRLDWRKQSHVSSNIVTNFGAQVASLKTSHREDIHSLLLKELSDENRERIVVSLTTALCIEPEAADSEVLWSIATAPHAHEKARILAVVALSKLGDRRAIPLLHEIIRSFIAPDPERKIRTPFPPGSWSLPIRRTQSRRLSLLDYSLGRPSFYQPVLELHHVDLGLALRRLGDETLVTELVEALSDLRGEFSMLAYRFLGGIVGLRAYDHARQWIESQDIDSSKILPMLAASLLNYDVPPEEILPLLVKDEVQVRYNIQHFMSAKVTLTTDALVDAFHRPPKRSSTRIQIIRHICDFGDVRGIALAAKNPLFMASVVRYLPDAPGVDFPSGHFECNRIEEAMRVQVWYEQHADDLRWNPESSLFRLASHAP